MLSETATSHSTSADRVYKGSNFTGLYLGEEIPADKKEEYLDFIRANIKDLSRREIARQLGIGRTTVTRWSKELGYKFIKHTVNESFFEEITPEVAYILGFIFADGNVHYDPHPKKKYQAMTITTAAKDKDHLEIIRKLMQSTKPLLYSKKTNSYRLIVNSKKICLDLIALGVTPNKSLTVQFPEYLEEENLSHFLRGVIDGDGTVFFNNRKRSPYLAVRVYSGSFRFCEDFEKTIRERIGVKGYIRQVGKNTHGINYSCTRARKVASYIYSNATIFLNRKYQAYQKCLEIRNEVNKKNGK